MGLQKGGAVSATEWVTDGGMAPHLSQDFPPELSYAGSTRCRLTVDKMRSRASRQYLVLAHGPSVAQAVSTRCLLTGHRSRQPSVSCAGSRAVSRASRQYAVLATGRASSQYPLPAKGRLIALAVSIRCWLTGRQ